MFKKVLICSDISDASNVLLSCVEDLKEIGVKEAILGHAVYPGGVEERFNYEAHEDTIPSDIQIVLEKQKAILEAGGIKTTIEIVHGTPAERLAELAEDYDVSAIVIGSHGKGILKRATLGSVSSEVINLAKRPVLLMRVTIDSSNAEIVFTCKQLFNHILYLTDFSETAEKALDYVVKIVAETQCPTRVLHVLDSEKITNQVRGLSEVDLSFLEKFLTQQSMQAEKNLKAIKSRLEEAGSKNVTIDYPEGRQIDVVMDQIKNNKGLSLIVMGSHGKGFAKELFYGSLSLQVSRYSPIPVLLIPVKFK